MGIELVGSLGAPSASGSPATPAWGSGSTRAEGNLLICWVVGDGTSIFPAVPAGWLEAIYYYNAFAGYWQSSVIFYRVATGGDAAPSITPASGTGDYVAMLGEFVGTDPTSPIDSWGYTGTVNGTATQFETDADVGDLIVCCTNYGESTGSTQSGGDVLNNGATPTCITNNATSTTQHYAFTWGVTTAASGPDAVTTGGWATGVGGVQSTGMASFKPMSSIACSGTMVATFSATATIGEFAAGSLTVEFAAIAAATSSTFVCSGTLAATFAATAVPTSVHPPPLVFTFA